MTSVTGLTAARMAEIEAASVVSGEVVGDNLILTKHDTTTIDAGNVRGPQGDEGPAGADGISIPSGGTTGQVLSKIDETDYNVMWSTFLRYAAMSIQFENYTLTLEDAETIVMVHSTDPKVITIPEDVDVDFPQGTRITIVQVNTGDVSIAGDLITGSSDYVGLGYPSLYTPTLLGQGAVVALIKVGSNAWILDGHGNLATTELGWQGFDPVVHALTSGPNLGTNPVKQGVFIIDSQRRVSGAGTIRWDSAGSPTQGTGVYRVNLPAEGVNVDTRGYTPIGSISAGMNNLTHKTGLLHFCGDLNNDSGNKDTTKAIGAMDEGLFLSESYPQGNAGGGNYNRNSGTLKVENIHYVFNYKKHV